MAPPTSRQLGLAPVGIAPVLDSVDERWPSELQLLLGPSAVELIDAALGQTGDTVAGVPKATQVVHRPGRSTTVNYRVDVESSSGARSNETVVASTGMPVPPATTQLSDGETTVATWRWTDDPFLPGLSAALDTSSVARLFDDVGIGGAPSELKLRAYRPGRRAVVEARNKRDRLFLKVVRPEKVHHLHELHRSLAEHLPVPNSAGWSDDGILVMPAVPGMTLRHALKLPTGKLPAPQAIEHILDALPAHLAQGPPRQHWLDLAKHHARVIGATVPAVAGQVDDLLAQLTDHHNTHGQVDHAVVPVHGDLYEAQFIVDSGKIVGLLDVDTAGAGHRIDDFANFCAHLSVLATVTANPGRIRQYGADLLAFAETRFDRHDLRARIAAATLGLATGSFRTLEPNWVANTSRRLTLAEQWISPGQR